jgi:hypothetical protein
VFRDAVTRRLLARVRGCLCCKVLKGSHDDSEGDSASRQLSRWRAGPELLFASGTGTLARAWSQWSAVAGWQWRLGLDLQDRWSTVCVGNVAGIRTGVYALDTVCIASTETMTLSWPERMRGWFYLHPVCLPPSAKNSLSLCHRVTTMPSLATCPRSVMLDMLVASYGRGGLWRA